AQPWPRNSFMANTFDSRATLTVDGQQYTYHCLPAVAKHFPQLARLPVTQRILLENLLRNEDGVSVRADDIRALAQWDAKAEPDREIGLTHSWVLLEGFTCVTAVVE